MNQLLYIVWNPDLVAFRLGPLSVRWYGLMWAIGIALAFSSFCGHYTSVCLRRLAQAGISASV